MTIQQPRHAGADANTRSAADVLLAQLAHCGIDYLLANGGSDFPPIVEAFARAAERGSRVPRPMVIPHENAAVAMAHGVYLVTGRPQAVMVHVNVGTANTLNALLDASRENIPLLLMAGRTPYSESGQFGARARYIHWAQEMFDQAAMVREAVKWDYELHMPDQAADAIVRALEVATTAPPGPVYLTLPREIIAAPSGVAASEAPRRTAVRTRVPDPEAVREAAEWIAGAERPLIVTANAGKTAEGFAALAACAEKLAIPVVSFHPRFASLPSSHAMHFGYQPWPLLADADVVLVLDCDVPWIPSQGQPRPGAKVIHAGMDPGFTRYPMRSFPGDLAIATDTAPFLATLVREAAAIGLDGARLERRRQALAVLRQKMQAEWQAKAAPKDGRITPEFISATIAKVAGTEATIVNEYPLRLEQAPRETPLSYFGLSPAGGLGWGLPCALGVKLADPKRTVIATLGDGAYVFANPTACHWIARAHDLPVLTVVFNNQLYGAVRNATSAMYADGASARAGGRTLADLTPAPDFETIVTASGGYGARVDEPEALEPALRRALAVVQGERRQALVNVVCDY
jgi:acetolactate synthase-1/2/3 large subunit